MEGREGSREGKSEDTTTGDGLPKDGYTARPLSPLLRGGFSWNKAPRLSLLAVAAKDDITTAIQKMRCLGLF